jgi:hypothetical protein
MGSAPAWWCRNHPNLLRDPPLPRADGWVRAGFVRETQISGGPSALTGPAMLGMGLLTKFIDKVGNTPTPML